MGRFSEPSLIDMLKNAVEDARGKSPDSFQSRDERGLDC
jgi:hypothetical protein